SGTSAVRPRRFHLTGMVEHQTQLCRQLAHLQLVEAPARSRILVQQPMADDSTIALPAAAIYFQQVFCQQCVETLGMVAEIVMQKTFFQSTHGALQSGTHDAPGRTRACAMPMACRLRP